MFSEDLWLYISQTYLVQEEVSRLSRTCRFIREVTLPVVFQDLCFTGFTPHQPLSSLEPLFKHFEWLERRAQFYTEDSHISSSVRMVTFRNWMFADGVLYHRQATRLGDKQTKRLQLCWRNSYLAVIKAINMFPSLRFIAFCEAGSFKDTLIIPFLTLKGVQDWNWLPSGLSEILILKVRNSASLIPASFITRKEVLAGDNREEYFTELITNTTLQIQTAGLRLAIFSQVSLTTISKFKDIQRLVIFGAGVYDFSNILALLSQAVELRSLTVFHLHPEINAVDFSRIRRLSSFNGDPGYMETICRSQTITGLRPSGDTQQAFAILDDLEISAKGKVQFLDLGSFRQIWDSDFLPKFALLFPHIKTLRLRMADRLYATSLMGHIFAHITSFHSLEFLQVTGFPNNIQRDLLSLPPYLKHKRPVPHLSEVEFSGITSFYWCFERGWATMISLGYDVEEILLEDPPLESQIQTSGRSNIFKRMNGFISGIGGKLIRGGSA